MTSAPKRMNFHIFQAGGKDRAQAGRCHPVAVTQCFLRGASRGSWSCKVIGHYWSLLPCVDFPPPPRARKGRCLGLGEIEALGEAVLGRQNWLRVQVWVLFAVGNSEWGEGQGLGQMT